MMKIPILFLGLIIISSILLSNHSFAVDFKDSTGYTPSWAKSMGHYQALSKCSTIIGETTRDGNWCFEWVAYVVDQGYENFPESAIGKQSITLQSSSFKLEDGPQYDGQLKKFFPDSYTFGDNWSVGNPSTIFATDDLDRIDGVIDWGGQLIVIPDDYDNLKHFASSYIIVEFESKNKIQSTFEDVRNAIKKLDLPTEDEFFELEKKGISLNGFQLESSKETFVVDCIGFVTDVYKDNEESFLVCVKDNYMIITQGVWNKGYVDNYYLWSRLSYPPYPQEIVLRYAEIISNKIDNHLHPNPEVYFPDEVRYVAFQYSIEAISDNELLKYFQKSIDEGKIRFPTKDIVIDKNSQRLSYIPDLGRVGIYDWSVGRLDDNKFADLILKWMVEKRYLTVSGLDSSSKTIQELKTTQLTEDDFPRYVESNETPTWVYAIIGFFVLFGIPAIIIGLIIWKIRQRRKTKLLERGFRN